LTIASHILVAGNLQQEFFPSQILAFIWAYSSSSPRKTVDLEAEFEQLANQIAHRKRHLAFSGDISDALERAVSFVCSLNNTFLIGSKIMLYSYIL
jgi:hypothetical protein